MTHLHGELSDGRRIAHPVTDADHALAVWELIHPLLPDDAWWSIADGAR